MKRKTTASAKKSADIIVDNVFAHEAGARITGDMSLSISTGHDHATMSLRFLKKGKQRCVSVDLKTDCDTRGALVCLGRLVGAAISEVDSVDR